MLTAKKEKSYSGTVAVVCGALVAVSPVELVIASVVLVAGLFLIKNRTISGALAAVSFTIAGFFWTVSYRFDLPIEIIYPELFFSVVFLLKVRKEIVGWMG